MAVFKCTGRYSPTAKGRTGIDVYKRQGIAVHMAGSPHTAAFTDFAVFLVEDVLHGKAGTGWADKVTASAGNTAAVVFFPHWQSQHIL